MKTATKNKIKHKIQYSAVVIFLLLLICMGIQIIFIGHLDNASASESVYMFNGFERILGIMPIGVGFGGLYLMWASRKES